MSAYLAPRVAKLEDRRRTPVHVSHVIEAHEGETTEDAVARFSERYGHDLPKRRHAVLIVPTWPTIDAFAAALKAQQTELIDWVRSQHPKEPASC
ncbi:hypothetical protein L288_09375 [Sphingobium quisquiliarum P25]|uniref:Uncharacterized protein n=1 Tax=Sphingobium quisquiliarum P25 TaxID=1329909 RepID=T0I831_9SPHN|nr:hypothetical protein [Sphingobium quisquiliarum]EQB07810.1 hypothetical protein L288_09375 [Sphingobium quisquiliarum P25]